MPASIPANPPCRNTHRAVLLDRDRTLIEDRGHLRSAADAVFFPETVASLALLQEEYLLFIVSNQSGVADGRLTVEEVEHVNGYVVNQLANAGVTITEVYWCPHKRSDDCMCIKPNPYFLRQAAEQHDVDLSRSFVIGDHPHDVYLADHTGARGTYVVSGHGRKHRGVGNRLPRTNLSTGTKGLFVFRPRHAVRDFFHPVSHPYSIGTSRIAWPPMSDMSASITVEASTVFFSILTLIRSAASRDPGTPS